MQQKGEIGIPISPFFVVVTRAWRIGSGDQPRATRIGSADQPRAKHVGCIGRYLYPKSTE
jgi:hypothetical protein